MTLGWGTVIRGSHHGQSPDFILGPLHNLNPLALALYIGLLAPVDILAGAETVLILHPACLAGSTMLCLGQAPLKSVATLCRLI